VCGAIGELHAQYIQLQFEAQLLARPHRFGGAEFAFGPQNFRFVVGRDGALYAFALAVPERGTTVRITSLGADAKLLDSPIAKVTLLGHRDGVRWKQKAGALEIDYPRDMLANTAVVFRVAASASAASP
jgi:hypothetical protein